MFDYCSGGNNFDAKSSFKRDVAHVFAGAGKGGINVIYISK